MALSANWKTRFIATLRDTGNVTKACLSAKVSRPTAYTERKVNETFALEWDNALEDVADELEDVARQRAVDGSDVLLIFLLKGLKPDKYRENRRLEIAGDANAPLRIEVTYADDSADPTEAPPEAT